MDRYDGSIRLITGSMFSGKTSTLINIIERYLISKKNCVVLKWRGDVRYTDKPVIVTHSGLECPCIPCDNDDITGDKIPPIYEHIKDNEIICIDEGAFFKHIVNFCEMLANNGHTVIVASLIGNYQREGFNEILNLMPKCERIDYLNAVCMKCFKEGASFTKRLIDSDMIELVGGSKEYAAMCRKCYFSS